MEQFLYQLALVLLNAGMILYPCTNVLLYPIRKNEKAFIYIFLVVILYFFTGKLGQTTSFLVVGVILGFILLFTRQNKLINACAALLGYLCSVVINHVFTITLSLFGITMQMIESVFAFRFSVIFFLTLYAITYFIGKWIRKRAFLYDLKTPQFVTISLFADTLICVIIFIFNITVGERMGYSSEVIRLNGILFFLFFIVTFVITIIIILSYEKDKKVTQKLKEFENLQDYTKKIEDLYMELRTFKHDYFNILASLSAYIESNNMKGLKEYFENSILIAGEKLDHKNTVLAALSYMKVEEIKGLAYTKLFHAMQKGIQIELDIKEPIEYMYMDILDLTRVLGIFLDNAAEAAIDSGHNRLYLGFAKRDDSVLAVIENSCAMETIDIRQIYQLGFSTKGDNRGVGLFQVQKILQKYKNVIHTTRYKDGVFTQRIELMKVKTDT